MLLFIYFVRFTLSSCCWLALLCISGDCCRILVLLCMTEVLLKYSGFLFVARVRSRLAKRTLRPRHASVTGNCPNSLLRYCKAPIALLLAFEEALVCFRGMAFGICSTLYRGIHVAYSHLLVSNSMNSSNLAFCLCVDDTRFSCQQEEWLSSDGGLRIDETWRTHKLTWEGRRSFLATLELAAQRHNESLTNYDCCLHYSS